MNIYKISQGTVVGLDTYDTAVVVAKSAADARKIHPESGAWDGEENVTWAAARDVQAEYVGKAKRGLQRSVVCSSFHAG